MGGWTTLTKACISGEFKERLLLSHIRDIHTTSCLGSSPLQFAVLGGNLCTVSLLLESGAIVNHQNDNKETVLHWACKEGDSEMVALLLLYGADHSLRDKDGNGPLHWAAEHEHPDVVEVLLKHGASMRSLNKSKETPLATAVHHYSQRCVMLMLCVLGDDTPEEYTNVEKCK